MAMESTGEKVERRRTKWAKKVIPEKIRNFFPSEESHKQLYFVMGLVFSSLVSEYVFAILITFLTDVWELKLMDAVLITNLQGGVTSILEIFIAYLADAHLGYFWMLFFATLGYCVGLGLLSHSYPHFTAVEINACIIRNICPSKPLTWSFYVALILITLGQSGTYLSLSELNPGTCERNEGSEERANKKRVRISWIIFYVLGSLGGSFALPYIPLAWKSELRICAYMMSVSFVIYWMGTLFYPPDEAQKSPLSYVPRVLVAAMRKKDRAFIKNPRFYTGNENNVNSQACPSGHDILRCLNKASIIESPTSNLSLVDHWRLCTVEEVEDTKILLRMVPMSTTFLMYGVVKSIGNTFFLEQANDMDSSLGSIKNFPLAAFLLLSTTVGYVTNKIYDMVMKKWECVSNKRVLDALKILLGMVMCMACCVVAWRVERKRLRIIKDNPLDYPIPMSVFWLTPQFVLLGAMDGLAKNGVEGFFGHQVPGSVKRYGAALAECVTGMGTILRLAMIFIIQTATRKGDSSGWFAESIAQRRLDSFYKTLSILSSINTCLYVLVATKYSYN